MKRAKTLVVVAALLAVGWPAAVEAQPTLTFEPTAVVVGLPAGGSAAVMSVTRRPVEYSVKIEKRLEVVTDDDNDGQARLEVGDGVYLASAWWAVDLASGGFAVGAPEDYPVSWLATDEESLEAPTTPSPDLAIFHHSRLELLVVRPGTGAWRTSAVDGGSADLDGEPDGVIHIGFAGMAPVASEGTALAGLQSGDLLFAIEPNTLEVLTLAPQVGTLGGAR